MDKKIKITNRFTQGFFTNIKLKKTNVAQNEKYDKHFEWSKNVLEEKSKVKIVLLNNKW